jgi:CBS domain-containing protein
MKLRVRDGMTAEVVTVGPDLSLAEFERLLSERRVSGAPVVDDGKLLGVISRTDVVRLLGQQEGVAEMTVSFYQTPWDEDVSAVELMERVSDAFGERLRHLRVRDAMSGHVIFTSRDAPLEEAARIMTEYGVHRLLVWEDGEVCGIVTSLDVVGAVAERGLGEREGG